MDAGEVTASGRLLAAVTKGDEARVLALLAQEGVDVNERDPTTGGWPLLAAAQRQNLAIAQLLVDHGARCCSHHSTATTTELHALAEAEKGPFPVRQAVTTATRLVGGIRTWLAPSASVKLWQLLLDNGASATAPAMDGGGATPLHVACANGNWPVVQFLLQGRHVDDYGMNKRDDHRETPLHYAARHGHTGVVSVLLARGANPLAVGAHGDASEVARQAGHGTIADMIQAHAYRTCPLLCLPDEVLLSVLEALDPYDLCTVAQVCSVLNELSSVSCLWRRFCDARWVDAKDTPWKSRYLAWLKPRLRRRLARHRQQAHMQKELEEGEWSRPSSSSSSTPPTLKFIILGDPGVGKTALKRRFVSGTFINGETSSGYYLGSKRLNLDGQHERFNALPRIFYRAARAALVVYDIANRTSFDHIRRWVDCILANTSDAVSDEPLVMTLVGAKSDKEAHRQVSMAEGQALALELGMAWAEVSNLTGSGVNEMFENSALATMADELAPPIATGGFMCHLPDEAVLRQLTHPVQKPTNTTSSACTLQ